MVDRHKQELMEAAWQEGWAAALWASQNRAEARAGQFGGGNAPSQTSKAGSGAKTFAKKKPAEIRLCRCVLYVVSEQLNGLTEQYYT